MTAKLYIALAETTNAKYVADAVDTLTHAERIELRTALEAMGYQKLVKNLYYDYDKQCWIGM